MDSVSQNNQNSKKRKQEELHSINYYGQFMHWSKSLGRDVFSVWLELFCYVDRTGDWKKGDAEIIRYPIRELAKFLDISYKQFQTRYIPILWNYGLIDLFEYENATNIIVYRVPLNRVDQGLEYGPIEKIRDYKNEYRTRKRSSGLKGGRPKKEDGWLRKGNQDGYENVSMMVTKTKPINIIRTNNIKKYDNQSEENQKIEQQNLSNQKNELFIFVNRLMIDEEIKQVLFNESYFYENKKQLNAFRNLGKPIEKLCIQLSLKTKEEAITLKELLIGLIYDDFKDDKGNPINNIYAYMLKSYKNNMNKSEESIAINKQPKEEKQSVLKYDLTGHWDL